MALLGTLGAVGLAACGAGGGADPKAMDRVVSRCAAAAKAIGERPRPRTGAALRERAGLAADDVVRAIASPSEEPDLKRAQAAAARIRDGLREVAGSTGADPFPREEGVLAVEQGSKALADALGGACARSLSSGTARLRTVHYALAIGSLDGALEPKKVRLDDNSLLGDANHLAFAVDQYKGAISRALQLVQTVQAPPSARPAARAYKARVRALARSATRLYRRSFPGTPSAANAARTLRRDAAAAERAFDALRASLR